MSISQTAKIHSSAIIENGAVIGDNVYVGPFCCVGPNVILEKDVVLKSHVVISGDTIIGEKSIVYPFASLGLTPQDLKYRGERSKLEIGKNTTIREYVTASIGTEVGGMTTKIGDNCLIMAYCHIAHDCIIGNNVILVNGVNLSGHVVVDDFAIIGGLSAVKQFTRIGRHAMIGGCTGVERDVIPFGLARSERNTILRGLNIIGMKRHGIDIDTIKEMLDAFKELFSEDNNKTLISRADEILKKYPENDKIRQIVDFIKNDSKNPICTCVPSDSD